MSENGTWLRDQHYVVNGKHVSRVTDEKLPANLGKGLLDFRKEHPEMYQRAKAAGIDFYQQPSGFEDSLIVNWKLSVKLR